MLLSCVFIYRFICARVFKYILNYVLIQQNVKQSLLDSFLDLHSKIVTITLEKCLFSTFFKCLSYLLLEKWEMSSKLQKNNKIAKITFSSFFFV